MKTMCELLSIPRTSYYELLNRKESKRSIHRRVLKEKIKVEYGKSEGKYGSVKVYKELKKNGLKVSFRLVQKLMKEEGLRSITIKKYKHHTSKIAIEAPAPNILNRNFKSNKRGEKIVGDITYIYTKKDGWCYLASFMDLYSRRIVGWTFGKKMTTELVLKALEMTVKNVEILEECILHSDLGSQYTSKNYMKVAKKLGFKLSYSRKGNLYDNACIEAFHSVLKKEMIYRKEQVSYEESKLLIFEYIESWYNRRRSHSKLDYLSPIEFESKSA